MNLDKTAGYNVVGFLQGYIHMQNILSIQSFVSPPKEGLIVYSLPVISKSLDLYAAKPKHTQKHFTFGSVLVASRLREDFFEFRDYRTFDMFPPDGGTFDCNTAYL